MKYKLNDIVLVNYTGIQPPYNYYIGYIQETNVNNPYSILTEVLNPKKTPLGGLDGMKVYGWDKSTFKSVMYSKQELYNITKYTGKFWFIDPAMIVCKLDPAREDFDRILSIFSSEDPDAHKFMLEVLKNETL